MTPAHQLHRFHPRARPVALLIGVWNEGPRITAQLEALQPYRDRVDILIADGASTDGATTPGSLREKTCALLVNTSAQKSLSTQYRIGLAYALQEGYDAVIMMDGNHKDGPEAIPRFIAALENGADFVQGSRFMPGGTHAHTPLARVLGIRLVFNPLMRLASGYAYTDAMNGFKGVSRRLLTHPGLQPFRDRFTGYSLQYYLNYRAPQLGLRIEEIPVSRSYRKGQGVQSKIMGARAWLAILCQLLATVTGRHTPPNA
ncbi:MAG: glycosyltransferase family 2 protein [Rickettsiales bacterium]|nr:glycosyltransferase family 2 protein [Rickettsiales bacterium]